MYRWKTAVVLIAGIGFIGGCASEPTKSDPAASIESGAVETDSGSLEEIMIGSWSCMNSDKVGPAFDTWGDRYEHVRDDAVMTFTAEEFSVQHDGKEAQGTWKLEDHQLTLKAGIFPEHWMGSAMTWRITNFPETIDEAKEGVFLSTDAEDNGHQSIAMRLLNETTVHLTDVDAREATCSKALQ